MSDMVEAYDEEVTFSNKLGFECFLNVREILRPSVNAARRSRRRLQIILHSEPKPAL